VLAETLVPRLPGVCPTLAFPETGSGRKRKKAEEANGQSTEKNPRRRAGTNAPFPHLIWLTKLLVKSIHFPGKLVQRGPSRDDHSPQGDIYRRRGMRTALWGFEIPLWSSAREVLPGLTWSKPSKIDSLQSPLTTFWDIAFRGTAVPAGLWAVW